MCTSGVKAESGLGVDCKSKLFKLFLKIDSNV